jgi:hypothetical protein
MRKLSKGSQRVLKESMPQSSQFKKNATAVIQVTALLLLRVYSVLPVFGHFVAPVRHGAVCHRDHRLCGCSVEKIVNRTCCCFKSAETAMSMVDHHEMKSMPESGMERLARFVCPPCGNDPDFVPASLEKIKFLRFAATSEGPVLLWVFNLSHSGDTFHTRANEPPDPLPKSIPS